MKNEHPEQEQWHESTSVSTKSSIRHSHPIKKSEKAHVRKSLDSRNVHPSNISGKASDLSYSKVFKEQPERPVRWMRAKSKFCVKVIKS